MILKSLNSLDTNQNVLYNIANSIADRFLCMDKCLCMHSNKAQIL